MLSLSPFHFLFFLMEYVRQTLLFKDFKDFHNIDEICFFFNYNISINLKQLLLFMRNLH